MVGQPFSHREDTEDTNIRHSEHAPGATEGTPSELPALSLLPLLQQGLAAGRFGSSSERSPGMAITDEANILLARDWLLRGSWPLSAPQWLSPSSDSLPVQQTESHRQDNNRLSNLVQHSGGEAPLGRQQHAQVAGSATAGLMAHAPFIQQLSLAAGLGPAAASPQLGLNLLPQNPQLANGSQLTASGVPLVQTPSLGPQSLLALSQLMQGSPHSQHLLVPSLSQSTDVPSNVVGGANISAQLLERQLRSLAAIVDASSRNPMVRPSDVSQRPFKRPRTGEFSTDLADASRLAQATSVGNHMVEALRGHTVYYNQSAVPASSQPPSLTPIGGMPLSSTLQPNDAVAVQQAQVSCSIQDL